MKLIRARVTNFKSIDDSGWVTLDNVTCMVGKNESGKTAFLQALRRINPVDSANSGFDLRDYPRKGYVRYKRRHDEEPATVVRVEFELTEPEMDELESEFGQGVLRSSTVVVSKNYKDELSWSIDVNESAVVKSVIKRATLPLEVQRYAGDSDTWEQLKARLESLEARPPNAQQLLDELQKRFEKGVEQQIIENHLMPNLPVFVYFDNYSGMRGRISIQDIKRKQFNPQDVDDADRIFLALLNLVGADLGDLESETNYEYLKAELESASIGISDEIFEFWKQNTQLRVEFDLSPANPKDAPPLNEGTILHVRIWNDRHRVSVPFDERSRGFVWFFSFLVYFSQMEEEKEGHLVLLLDEPGLNLHALAQYDFLRFIDERLAPRHQVIYTTHSPFMINLDHLSRVRTVEDMDKLGTTVGGDILRNSRETVFPLEMALGYQMAQTLFMAPHCLLVNSASDLIYLQVLGEACTAQGRFRLDPRWVIIPVGNSENLPAFVSLLGDSYTSVAVLMDVTPTDKEHIDRINESGAVGGRSPVRWVEVNRVRDADIEDLMDPGFYLKLVNESYGSELPQPLTLRSITDSNPRIVRRVQAYFESAGIAGGNFDAYRPAAHLLQNHGELSRQLNDSTIANVASMFERINALLGDRSTMPDRRLNGAEQNVPEGDGVLAIDR
jgi:predicted ATP-dependent endonuclease of OLD family